MKEIKLSKFQSSNQNFEVYSDSEGMTSNLLEDIIYSKEVMPRVSFLKNLVKATIPFPKN